MTAFTDNFAAAAAILFAEFAGTVTYTTRAGVASSLSGMIGAEKIETRYKGNERVKVRARSVTVKATDLVAPAENATVTIAGEVWSVERITKGEGNLQILGLTRPGASEVARPDYRGRPA